MKVKGPGKLRFSTRNTALSTRQYSATRAMSGNRAEKRVSLLPSMRRRRSMARAERIEQANA